MDSQFFSDFSEMANFFRFGIRQPDMIVDLILTDKAYRESYNLPYPFLGDKEKYSGCYALFSLDCGDAPPGRIWYVGRSKVMHIRLYQHWAGSSGSTIIDRIDETHEFLPCILAAIWFEDDARKRVLLEHELIAKVKPPMNKA